MRTTRQQDTPEPDQPWPEVRRTAAEVPPGTRPVLLLHRAGGSSRHWEGQLEGLSGERLLIAPDLPGHGRTPGPSLSTIAEMAALVSRLLDELELRDLLLVGHSMGGAVALELALERPDLAAGLLMVASGAKLRVAAPVLDAIRDHFDQLPQLMGRMIFGPATPPEVVREQLPQIFDATAEVVLSDLEACQAFDAEPRLGRLSIPVRVLAGKDDVLTPPRLGRRLVERVDGARLEVVPGAGHLLPQERPDVVNRAIRELSRAGEAG